MYGIDAEGEITHTSQMRVQETRAGGLRFGAVRPMDEARIAEMQKAVRDMMQLNRQIWDLLDALREHMDGAAPSAAE